MTKGAFHRRGSKLRDAQFDETEEGTVLRDRRRLELNGILLVQMQNALWSEPRFALPGGGSVTVIEAHHIAKRNGWPHPKLVRW